MSGKYCKIIRLVVISLIAASLGISCSKDSTSNNNDNDNDKDNNNSSWEQKEFIVGAYDGVRLTGIEEEDKAILKTFSDAGFNLMVGTHYWYCSRSFDISGKSNNPKAVSIEYVLERLADFNKDSGENKIRLLSDDKAFSNDIIPINMPFYKVSFKKYLYMHQELRDCLYGYKLIDEPDLERLRECLSAIQSIKEIDPGKIAFVNLGDGGYADVKAFFENDDLFRTYVKELAENGSVVSFDNYHWITGTDIPSKTISGKFFRMAEIVAEEAKTANVPWWGMALSVEHVKRNPEKSIRWGFRLRDPDRLDPKAELGRFRFSAYANIIYGAKGVSWYMYDTSNTSITNPENEEIHMDIYNGYSYHDACLDYDGNPTVFYDYVKEVNEKMRNLGPVLMDLTWLATVHGSRDNNYENVPCGTLPVVQGDTPVIASMPADNTLAVGIFESKDKNQYLIVMNKDIEEDKSYQIDLKNARKLYQYNCDTRKWSKTKISAPGTFTVDVEAGDIELFKIIAK